MIKYDRCSHCHAVLSFQPPASHITWACFSDCASYAGSIGRYGHKPFLDIRPRAEAGRKNYCVKFLSSVIRKNHTVALISMMARSTTRSNQRPDTLMQDRICQVDETSCNARPDHTFGSIASLWQRAGPVYPPTPDIPPHRTN